MKNALYDKISNSSLHALRMKEMKSLQKLLTDLDNIVIF